MLSIVNIVVINIIIEQMAIVAFHWLVSVQ